MPAPSLSIILPCHNEELAIPKTLKKLLEAKAYWKNRGLFSFCEILVVDDGSSDRSLEKLQPYSSEIEIIQLESNQGYGKALKIGFQRAMGDLVCFFDLDETCNPKDILQLADKLKTEKAHLALGNRLHNKSSMPSHRQAGNKLYRYLIYKMLGNKIKDCCTGFRLFKRELIPFFDDLPNDLNFSLAMTIKCLKKPYKIIECNIDYDERIGTSKLNSIYHGFQFLHTTINYSRGSKIKNV